MKLSIVIPAYNSESTLSNVLDAIFLAIKGRCDVEVILVDNCSTDRTADIAESYDFVQVVKSNARFVGGVRNDGVKYARGEIVYNVDADCLVRPDCVDAICNALSSEEVGAVGGVYLKSDNPTWVEDGYVLVSPEGLSGETDSLVGGTLALRKSVFYEIGGFDENIDAGEDTKLAREIKKKGYKILRLPECSVVHLGNAKTVGKFVKRQIWHGSSYFGVHSIEADRAFYATVAFIFFVLVMFAGFWNEFYFWVGLLGVAALVLAFTLLRFVKQKCKFELVLFLKAMAVSFFYFIGRSIGLFYGVYRSFLARSGHVFSLRK